MRNRNTSDSSGYAQLAYNRFNKFVQVLNIAFGDTVDLAQLELGIFMDNQISEADRENDIRVCHVRPALFCG